MGFYSPASLIGDVRRHGVEVRGVDINASAARASLETLPARGGTPPPRGQAPGPHGPEPPGEVPYAQGVQPAGRDAGPPPRDPAPSGGRPVPGQPAIRLGLASVRNLGTDPAEAIARGQPYTDLADFARRTRLPARSIEALAMAGAFGCFGMSRRAALWAAGAAATIRPGQLPGTTPGLAAPPLPAMTATEETFADLWATGTSSVHPVAHIRRPLAERGVIEAAALRTARPGAVVRVAGLVTHRQQPGTARGVVFLSLEDETGMANVICPPQVWERYRRLAMDAAALIVHGRVESLDGSVSLLAIRLRRIPVVAAARSRDFR